MFASDMVSVWEKQPDNQLISKSSKLFATAPRISIDDDIVYSPVSSAIGSAATGADRFRLPGGVVTGHNRSGQIRGALMRVQWSTA